MQNIITNFVKLLSLFLVVVLLQACDPSQKSQNHLQDIIDAGVLNIGVLHGSTHYSLGANGPQGLDYELAKRFSQQLGVTLNVHPHYTRDALYQLLEQNKIDVIATGTSINTHKNQFKFAPSYQNVAHYLVYKQGVPKPNSPADIHGSVVIAEDIEFAQWLAANPQEDIVWRNVDWEMSSSEDINELALSIESGTLDYTIIDSVRLGKLQRLHPNLNIGFTVMEAQPNAWALNKNKDDSLQGALVEYFGEVRRNATLAVLEAKYVDHHETFNYIDTKAFLQAATEQLPKYRAWFEKYSSNIEWQLLAAMSYQESRWLPSADSYLGTRGLMMLTKDTARSLNLVSRLDPEASIRGGAQYLESLLRRIPARIQQTDRIWFALAAYNIGLEHLEDARILTQKHGGNPDLWIDVKKHLPLLSKKRHYRSSQYGYANGHEAITYVSNVRRYYDSLIYLLKNKPTKE